MLFVFEDNPDDNLSVLFKAMYPENVACKFIYCYGNGNIVSVVEEYLSNTNEVICVFLDTIPGNKYIIEKYKTLANISKENNYRVIVINIICAEYYFIKAFGENRQLFISDEGYNEIVNKLAFKDSSLIQTDKDREFVTTFEKFTKLFLNKNAISCVKNSSMMNPEGNEINYCYGVFYENDCVYPVTSNNSKLSLTEKSKKLLMQYPCVPSGHLSKKGARLCNDQLWDLHRRLIQEYNDFVERLRPFNKDKLYGRLIKISAIK